MSNILHETYQDGAHFFARVNGASEHKLIFSYPGRVPDGDLKRAKEARALFIKAMQDRSIQIEWEQV